MPGSETDATGVVSLLENLITGYLHVATGSFIGASPLDSGNQQAGARNALGGVPFQTVWETDASGINLYQSPSWYHYIGEGPGSSFGQGWLDYYHPEDRAALLAAWNRCLQSPGEQPYDIEARIRRHDGIYRWFRIQGAPLRMPGGQVVKWVGTCTDVDDEKGGAPTRAAAATHAAPGSPARPWFTGLERRLFLMAVAASLPMIAIAAYTLYSNVQENKAQVLASAEGQMQALTTAVDTELNLSIASLEGMASSSRVIAADVAGFRREAIAYLASNPGWANVILHAPDGTQVMNVRVPEGATPPRTPAPALIAAVRADGRARASGVIFSPVLGKFAVGVAVPVLRDGQLVGVLSAVMLPQAWQSLVDRQKLPPGAVLGVFDAEQRVVARSANPALWVGKSGSEGIAAVIRRSAASGWGETKTLRSGARVHGLQPIGEHRLVGCGRHPEELRGRTGSPRNHRARWGNDAVNVRQSACCDLSRENDRPTHARARASGRGFRDRSDAYDSADGLA